MKSSFHVRNGENGEPKKDNWFLFGPPRSWGGWATASSSYLECYCINVHRCLRRSSGPAGLWAGQAGRESPAQVIWIKPVYRRTEQRRQNLFFLKRPHKLTKSSPLFLAFLEKKNFTLVCSLIPIIVSQKFCNLITTRQGILDTRFIQIVIHLVEICRRQRIINLLFKR